MSTYLESLFYDRENTEAWCALVEYLSIAPHPRTLVELLEHCPFQARQPVVEQLLAIADGRDRHGRMHAADGVTLRRELFELCERQGDDRTVALLAGRAGLQAEKDGDIDQAVVLWRKAVKAGSADPHVADRFTIWLLKNGGQQEAADVLNSALVVPNVPSTLRERMQKRLERCSRGK